MSTITVKDFVKKYASDKVYYDPSFQRRVVWGPNTLSRYIRSLTNGTAKLTTIVVVNIRDCLDRAREIGDQYSISYYESLANQGYIYISLDGQNRSKKIIDFINNDIAVSGNFYDVGDPPSEVAIINHFFKDLSPELQLSINNSMLSVEETGTLSRTELSETFYSLNNGVPLNAQEKRNSVICPISEKVRQLSARHAKGLARVVKEGLIPRMADDELVAHMSMVLLENKPPKNTSWGLSESETDMFYNMGIDSDIDDNDYPYHGMDRVEEILHQWDLAIQAQGVYPASKLVSAKMSWATLYACAWAHDNGYTVNPDKRKEFFKALKELDDRLATQSENLYATERTRYMRKGLDPDEVRKSSYYFNWTGLPHQISARQKRIGELVKEISSSTRKFHLRKIRLGVNEIAAK
jgi:hypothetical protein